MGVGPPSAQCMRCGHYRGVRLRHPQDKYREQLAEDSCAAFPSAIPQDIWTGRFDHRQAHPGDHGLQWIPATPGTVHPAAPDALRAQ